MLYRSPQAIETYIAGLGRTFAKDAGLWWPIAASAVGVSAPADTSEDILATITIPAGALGANGGVRIKSAWTLTSSGNNKTVRARLGGISGTVFQSVTYTTVANAITESAFHNRNSASTQMFFHLSTRATDAIYNLYGYSTMAQNTANALDIVLTAQKASGGETMTLEYYTVDMLYKA